MAEVSAEALLQALDRRVAQRKLLRYRPYSWQREFHDAGVTHRERMLMAANRVGKTFSAAAEVAYHATGKYPEWWQGKRFTKPVLIWTGSVTNEASRDVVQKELLGEPAESFTGAIPAESMVGKPTYRQAGVSNVVDAFRVRHVSGGISTIVLKTYEQGWRKWQGAAVDVVWLDEEPDDFMVFTESLTRTITGKGILLVTFTPLLGATDLVTHFTEPKSDGVFLRTATWEDAPHLSEEDKAQLRASYPPHEVDARTRGVPMMGSGRVFPVNEDEIKCKPFEIPAYFAQICGIDFGIDHPAAASWLAWDRDKDIVYVTDCYRRANETAVYHAGAIKARGDWVPVAWPHDGMDRDKGSGEPLMKQYMRHGVNMLSHHAQYDDDRGNAVEPALMEMLERMKTGRFKVFSHLEEWFSEFRMYHRKDGKIVKEKDDIMSATRYGVMMLRYAAPKSLVGHVMGKRPPSRPLLRNWG